jgi:hypothetical protein
MIETAVSLTGQCVVEQDDDIFGSVLAMELFS